MNSHRQSGRRGRARRGAARAAVVALLLGIALALIGVRTLLVRSPPPSDAGAAPVAEAPSAGQATQASLRDPPEPTAERSAESPQASDVPASAPALTTESPEDRAASFEQKYAGLDSKEIRARLAHFKVDFDLRTNELLDERQSRGLVRMEDGKFDEATGGYEFVTTGQDPLRRMRSIPGVKGQMECVELPFDEYPEHYAMYDELKWLMTKQFLLEMASKDAATTNH